MGFYKNLKAEIEDDPDICFYCGHAARDRHHDWYVSEGNPDPRGNIPLCRDCHIQVHSEREDFKRWGQKGGKKTAQNPENWKKNLKQYRQVALS